MAEATNDVTKNESHDSDPVHDKPGSLWILWIVLVLLIAYPLSTGPVLKFVKRPPPPPIIALYMPLNLIYEKSPTARKVFDGYSHLWGIR